MLLIIARPFVFHGGVERATAGLVDALVQHGYDVHLLSAYGQARMPGVTRRGLPLPPPPSVARALALAAVARVVVAGGGWDVVQSHERTLRQDIYRAGEGCHRAYLESMSDSRRRRPLFHRVVLELERRVFAATAHIVAISRRSAAEIADLYGVPRERLSVVYNGRDPQRFHPKNRAAHPYLARPTAGGAAAAEGIVDGQSGAVADPRDARGIATALGRLRDRNPDELTDAARRAAEPFTFAAQVAGFARIYHRIAAARHDFP